MDTSPLFSDKSVDETKEIIKNLEEGSDNKLILILEEYKGLLELQSNERNELLKQVDTLSKRSDDIDNLDTKIEHLVALLSDVREQISALSGAAPLELTKKIEEAKLVVPSVDPFLKKSNVVATTEEIEELSTNIEAEAINLDEEVKALSLLIDNKSDELKQKDDFIDELNLKLEYVSDEKERLASQLENMNSVIGSWQGQLNLLQKLAASDPRYKVIGALKKHGSLSDIQLAFTMGTSIGQIRKYIDDLRELDLVRKDNSGRYQWIGSKMAEDEFNL